MTQIFVESCVDLEVAHLSVFMVWRLPYPEVPTLSRYLLVILQLVSQSVGCALCIPARKIDHYLTSKTVTWPALCVARNTDLYELDSLQIYTDDTHRHSRCNLNKV